METELAVVTAVISEHRKGEDVGELYHRVGWPGWDGRGGEGRERGVVSVAVSGAFCLLHMLRSAFFSRTVLYHSGVRVVSS